MKVEANKDLLKSRLTEMIRKIKGQKNQDKGIAAFVVTYGALISALTTVLIGLSSYLSNFALYFNIAALITSATVTVIQAWDKLFNHKRLWIIQSEVINRLKELNEDLAHLEASDKLGQNEANECYERYKEIMRKWNSDWKELRSTE